MTWESNSSQERVHQSVIGRLVAVSCGEHCWTVWCEELSGEVVMFVMGLNSLRPAGWGRPGPVSVPPAGLGPAGLEISEWVPLKAVMAGGGRHTGGH